MFHDDMAGYFLAVVHGASGGDGVASRFYLEDAGGVGGVVFLVSPVGLVSVSDMENRF